MGFSGNKAFSYEDGSLKDFASWGIMTADFFIMGLIVMIKVPHCQRSLCDSNQSCQMLIIC